MRLVIDIACIVFLAFLVTASIAFAMNPSRNQPCEREATDWCRVDMNGYMEVK